MRHADSRELTPRGQRVHGPLIITYHYIRENAASGPPALSPTDFRRQLDLLLERYQIWPLSHIATMVAEGGFLPADVCALTFDDGLNEHYTVAYPELLQRGISGTFFPSSGPLLDGVLLDVHQIQQVVAAASVAQINERLRDLLERHAQKELLSALRRAHANSTETSRFDEPNLRFLKRALQRDLPNGLRQEVVHALYAEFVGVPERTMSAELYATLPQLRQMVRGGMEIGGHGSSHPWMTALTRAELEREFVESRRLLGEVYGSGAVPRNAVFCYPYGDHDLAVEREARRHGFAAGVSTEHGRVAAGARPFAIPRVDTTHVLEFISGEL